MKNNKDLKKDVCLQESDMSSIESNPFNIFKESLKSLNINKDIFDYSYIC